MEIEKHVCSLKYAKQLKELGMKQESLWYWFTDSYFEAATIKRHDEIPYPLSKKRQAVYSAYTVAELGEMLPIGYRSYYFDGHPSGGIWMCNDNEILGEADAKTEADARAKMLICLRK